MQIHEAHQNVARRRQGKRVGRGPASGSGKTCGRGHKGYKSRSGNSRYLYREGGQMPLVRRLPKRGFSNAAFARCPETVNVGDLARFEAGSEVTPEALKDKRLIRRITIDGVKVLGKGDLSVKLTVKAHAVSAGARQKIEAAGGTIELLKAGRHKPEPEAAEKAESAADESASE